jgi:hypothetical protein
MSYSISVIGRDKAKLKDAIRAQQTKEGANEHSGVPPWMADKLCEEVDRVRVYDYAGRAYGLQINANGSWHEQGANHTYSVNNVQMIE